MSTPPIESCPHQSPLSKSCCGDVVTCDLINADQYSNPGHCRLNELLNEDCTYIDCPVYRQSKISPDIKNFVYFIPRHSSFDSNFTHYIGNCQQKIDHPTLWGSLHCQEIIGDTETIGATWSLKRKLRQATFVKIPNCLKCPVYRGCNSTENL